MALPASGVPTWIPLLPLAKFAGRDGRGPYQTDETAVGAQFIAWGMPLMGDYEHQSLYAPDNGQPAPASGSVASLEARDGILGGNVKWTERAAAMVAAREYLYISPVFDHLPDGTVIRLTGWTLTNNPNLYLPAIARREGKKTEENHTMDQERVSKLLGWLIGDLNLPQTATPEDVQAHVKLIAESLNASQAAMSQIRTALGVAADATPEKLTQSFQARLAQTEPDPARYVPMADFQRVSTALHTVQTQQSAAAADLAVSAAMAAGKVAPGMEPWARDYCSRDLKGFEMYVATAPVIVAAHATVTGKPPADGTNPLLADAKKRAGK